MISMKDGITRKNQDAELVYFGEWNYRFIFINI